MNINNRPKKGDVAVPNYQVLFFEGTNGDVPVEEFINSLDVKMSAKTYRLLMMISENGPDLREPYSKFLGDGIFELRVQQGSGISRVLYFFTSGKRVVLTNAFTKKTQKTPRTEIDKAKACRQEYLDREANNNENA